MLIGESDTRSRLLDAQNKGFIVLELSEVFQFEKVCW